MGEWIWVALVVVAFLASVVAALTGFGSAVLLLPFLIEAVGPRDAVVVLTVAQLLGNLGRVRAYRREVEWRVVGWYSLGAVPAATLGCSCSPLKMTKTSFPRHPPVNSTG